jgi:hypothetical protein
VRDIRACAECGRGAIIEPLVQREPNVASINMTNAHNVHHQRTGLIGLARCMGFAVVMRKSPARAGVDATQ